MAIRFKKNSTWREAERDIRTFRMWQREEITTDYACELIASNNDLPEVRPEDFVEEAELLGYRRRKHYGE